MGRTGMIIAALLIVAPVSATAATKAADAPRYSPKYVRCLAEPGDQEPVDCALVECDFQDRRLNRAYKAALADLAKKPAAKAALIKAQRAWLVFRNADVDAVKALSGSPGPSFDALIRELEHTTRRAQELEDMLKP
ncbi:lysozyme inhibitor LprI family protein [Caulobacter vibrioides]|nr:lysozyme inhibitor LprI family protein [Caulobacter vibrioides]YP_002518454.3 YecT-family protein [Caulobacter vibrioides NA1000]ACL96546.3 YecT-family protein [Caulobacter vibrioides NA1000]QXZ51336.1 lysozyme inhibitor LprI family protein [Caulobacter vibrioides]